MWLLLGLMLVPLAHATCKAHKGAIHESKNLPIAFGRVNLQSDYLQPPGTLLASTAIPATNKFPADDVLWTCDLADLTFLYFVVATNGDSRYGGHHEVGMKNVYATWFDHVGLYLEIGGVPLSHYWQRVDLTSYRKTLDNKIEIRTRDVPDLHARLYKVSQLPGNGGNVLTCHVQKKPGPTGTPYNCKWSNGFIQLAGPGLRYNNIGDDSRNLWNREEAKNGLGYRLHNAMSLSAIPSCVVRSATPHVYFPTVSVRNMEDNDEVAANFSVQLECSNSALSGTGNGKTALAVQASSGASAAARRLGLVEAQGGSTYLVSDHYGDDPTLARGVGISLSSRTDQQRRYFATSPEPAVLAQNAGWYPFGDGASIVNASKHDGHTRWQVEFEGVLKRLPKETGENVTPGRVHATAQLRVKVP